MNVKIVHHTPINVAIQAIRTCYDSGDKSDTTYDAYQGFVLGKRDLKLVNQIIDSKHESTLEHISYNIEVKGISRLVLQELARHRIASFSVKSTRYTLKELKDELPFLGIEDTYDEDGTGKYINFVGKPAIDLASVKSLENLRQIIASGLYTNDEAKYCLPESYKVDLMMTFNVRSLRNFLHLRLSPRAHFEIRRLAELVLESIPIDHRILFLDCYK